MLYLSLDVVLIVDVVLLVDVVLIIRCGSYYIPHVFLYSS